MNFSPTQDHRFVIQFLEIKLQYFEFHSKNINAVTIQVQIQSQPSNQTTCKSYMCFPYPPRALPQRCKIHPSPNPFPQKEMEKRKSKQEETIPQLYTRIYIYIRHIHTYTYTYTERTKQQYLFTSSHQIPKFQTSKLPNYITIILIITTTAATTQNPRVKNATR